MYIPDLSPYSYDLPGKRENVLAVGWLSKEHAFVTGLPAIQFVEKLRKLIVRDLVKSMRGIHSCEFCGRSDIHACEGPESVVLGSAEVWVPSICDSSTIFAAPNLILHYIVDHHYRPPDAFVEAVLAFDPKSRWRPDPGLTE